MFNVYVNKIIKILSICILCINIIIISLFVIPPKYTYAASLNSYDFSYQPLPISDLNTLPDTSNFSVYSINPNHSDWFTYKVSNSDDTFIFCYYPENSPTSPFYCVFSISSNVSIREILNRYGSSSWNGSSISLNNYNSEYSFYYATGVEVYTTLNNIPLYNSIDEGFQAYLDYSNPITPSLYEGLSIPPGYMARITVTNGSSFDLNTSFNFRIPNTFGSSIYTQQYIFNDAANPLNVPTSSAITINWSPFGDLDVFNQSNKGLYSLSSTLSSYIWIINPTYSNYRNQGAGGIIETPRLNNAITLNNVNNVDTIRIFAMSASFGNSIGSFGNINNTPSPDDEYSAHVSSDGSIYWTNSNGDITTPPDYGNTSVENSPLTIVQQLDNLLSNLISRIERLLVAPVDYINMLINAANNFFHWLRGLWSWLPGPVIESITAVLIIMCTVGALKLLWR